MTDREKRETDKVKYPWFAYFQYGFHTITYLSDTEVEEAKRFIHYDLEQHGTKNALKGYIQIVTYGSR